MLLLADPFSFPVDGLIARLEEDHPGLPIIGGMASGGDQPGANTLVINGETYESGAVGIILGGGVRVRPVVSQGCRPIGTPLVVTKAEDNMLVELGGRPAFVQLRAVYETLDDHDHPQTDPVRCHSHSHRSPRDCRSDRYEIHGETRSAPHPNYRAVDPQG